MNRRGGKRLLVGVVLLLTGAALFVSTFASLNRGGAIDQQNRAQGKITVGLSEPGRYYVWDHYRTVFEGERIEHRSDFPDGITIQASMSTGIPVDFRPDSKRSWSIGNHAKRSVGYLDLREPGDVIVDVHGGVGDRILSISNTDIRGELWVGLRGFGFSLIVMAIGLPVACWGWIARSRSSSVASSAA